MTDIKAYLCDEAKRITTGPRRHDYGKPIDNMGRTALLITAYLHAKGIISRPDHLTAVDAAAILRMIKEARLIETPDHLDTYQDLVGYSLVGAEVAGVEAPGPPNPPDGERPYNTMVEVPHKVVRNGQRAIDEWIQAHRLPQTKDGPLI